MGKYYTLERILSTKDIDKQPPGVYICTGNRTAGKSFAWKQFRLKKFFQSGEQTVYLVRNKSDVRTFANALMQDIIDIKYPDKEVKVTIQGSELYAEMTIDDKVFGYVLSLYKAGSYKPISSMFTHVNWIVFDEFQPEDGKYLSDELEKLYNIHTSIARGEGEQSRYVPITLISNNISEINPYYRAFRITGKIQKNTRIMRGKGWVLEITVNENAKNAILSNPVAKAFAGAEQVQYSAMGKYLDNLDFIDDKGGEIPRRKHFQFAILADGGVGCGIWTSPEKPGILFVLNAYDIRPGRVYTMKEDMRTAALWGDEVPNVMKFLKSSYNSGICIFQNIQCKQIFLDFVNF